MSNPDRLLTIPVGGNQYIDVDLSRLFAPPVPNEEAVDFDFLLQVLRDERPPPKYWLRVAADCAASGHRDEAEVVARRAIELFARPRHTGVPPHPELVSIYNLLASLIMARARQAPTSVLPDARFKVLDAYATPVRSALYGEADMLIREAESIIQVAPQSRSSKQDDYAAARQATALSRGVQRLSRGLADTTTFDSILSQRPHHVIALLGKGCQLLRRKSYSEALAVYQSALRVYLANQVTGPDPRIGIGLAYWGLNLYDEARRAWRRSLTLDATNHSALTLLGLSSLSLFKSAEPLLPEGGNEDALRQDYYAEGIHLLSRAFHLNERNAITAVALAEHFIAKATMVISSGLLSDSSDSHWQVVRDMLTRALTLGEQAIQHADASRSTIQARLQHARALHIMSYVPGGEIALRTVAQRYYNLVLEECTRLTLARTSGGSIGTVSSKYIPPPEALAAVGLAQIQISTGSTSAAKETLLKHTTKAMTGGSSGVEILLLAAALRARQAHSEEPRTMLERALRVIEAAQVQVASGEVTRPAGQALLFTASSDKEKTPWKGEKLHSSSLRGIADLVARDPYILIDLAQMAQTQDPGLSGRSYASALQILNDHALVPMDQPLVQRVRANLGALVALQAQECDAEVKPSLFTTAIAEIQGVLAEVSQDKTNPVQVVSHYNLGRAFELAGQVAEAQQTYEELLEQHPEYVDAKVRLALMHSGHKADRTEKDLAYTLFRESIASAPANLDARIAYAVFLSGELAGSPTSVNWIGLRDFLAEPLKSPDLGVTTFGSKQAATEVYNKCRRDPASLAALGWCYYQAVLAMRSKLPAGQNPQQAKAERTKGLFRAIDLFDRAISQDKHCAFAAQGMAILLSEDVFEATERDTVALEERYRRNADEAISILSKVREVRSDASVHICIGHTLMRKKEYFRAIQSYELAESLFHPTGVTLTSLLQSMARAEYAEGLSIRSPAHLNRAIAHLVRVQRLMKESNTTASALEVRWVSYNEAVLRQRLLAMLHDVTPAYRTAQELRDAVQGMKSSIEVLTSLSPLAGARQLSHISSDVIDQRIKFATNVLLPQAATDLETQDAYEEGEKLKFQTAEQTRVERLRIQEEQRAQAEAERQRRAEELRTRREVAKEELQEKLDWSVLEAVQDQKAPRPKKKESNKKKGRKSRRQQDEDEGIVSGGSDLFESGISEEEGLTAEAVETKKQRKATAALDRIKKAKSKNGQSKGRGKGRGKGRSRKVADSEESGEDNPPELNDETEESASDTDRPKKRARKQPEIGDDDDVIDSDEEM